MESYSTGEIEFVCNHLELYLSKCIVENTKTNYMYEYLVDLTCFAMNVSRVRGKDASAVLGALAALSPEDMIVLVKGGLQYLGKAYGPGESIEQKYILKNHDIKIGFLDYLQGFITSRLNYLNSL